MPSPTDCHTHRVITQPTPTQQEKQHRHTVIVGFTRVVEVHDDASSEAVIRDEVAPDKTFTKAAIFKEKLSEEVKKRKINPKVVIEEDIVIGQK